MQIVLLSQMTIRSSELLLVSYCGLQSVRPDCSHAVKELSRDVKAPTQESLAKLKHLLIFGRHEAALRLRPCQMLANWKTTIDVVGYVDSDWAGCSKTRKCTGGSSIQVLGCDIVHTSRTQGTVALFSGEAVDKALTRHYF